jgi:hypothetical protein
VCRLSSATNGGTSSDFGLTRRLTHHKPWRENALLATLRCERVKGVNLEDSKSRYVARHNYQMVHDRSGSDQCILE